jgi:hypothetical protein
MSLVVAVDIGGTFTDLVLSLPNRTLSKKLLSTHDHPDTAVVEGTRLILSFHSGGAGARPQRDGRNGGGSGAKGSVRPARTGAERLATIPPATG